MAWLNIDDRRVFLIGAAGGIGEATVNAFLEQGARVAVFDRDQERLATVSSVLPKHSGGFELDLGRPDTIETVFGEAVSQVGAPDIMINLAVLSTPRPLVEMSSGELCTQLTVNTVSALGCAQAFKRLRNVDLPSAIVNVSSIAAEHCVAYGGGYSASKAALSTLTRQLAVEWGPLGIRSNLISPGLILTPLSSVFYADPEDRAAREAVVPVGRIGSPQDIADAILFLASPRSSYINGADMVVDGGFCRTLMSHIPRRNITDENQVTN